ncbi:MAG: bifunctional folylpolyglutamate synthase/dihydrofolate synthase [Clostridia bacterium]|nr:bifunctional folylpolyglutamate synthase/dihydrofolate synthase [Clostridia bacterium]
MTYQEAVEYLESSKNLGSRPGLDTIKELLRRMGNPEKHLRFIHVAGTNGKGSTAGFISYILEFAGYRVGFFSSPAVYHLLETIKLNNCNITEEQFASTLEQTRRAAELMKKDGLFPPTEFEVLTATAYAFFCHSSCDYVVVECGMGGRLDATNVMEHTEVSVLCRIAKDHVGFLGETLTDITKEKCGILRTKTPVAVYPFQDEEVVNEIKKNSELYSARVYVPDQDKLTIMQSDASGSLFSYGKYQNLQIELPGEHQVYNALTAICAIECLIDTGAKISKNAIKNGLRNAKWPGRFEILDKDLPVVLDGAHNLNGVLAFTDALKRCYPEKSMIGIVGMLRDKDYKASLSEFAKVCRMLVLTEVDSSRTAKAEEMEKAAQELGIDFVVIASPVEAVFYAFTIRKEVEGIFCAGSLYNLATFKKTCLEQIKLCKENGVSRK